MANRLLLICTALTCALLIVPAFASNGMEDIAVTVRQIGRGGAFIAAEPDAGALTGNPAAMAFLDGAEFYVDGRNWHTSLDYQGALNGLGQKENYAVPNIAYAGSCGDGFAAGFGIFTVVNSAFRVTDYDLSLAGAPPGTTDRTSTKARFVVFTPGIAYKLNDSTAVGAALHYTEGSASFQAVNVLGDTLGYSLDSLSGKGHALRLGLYHKASDDTTLGAYWRSRTHLEVTDGTLHMGQLTATPGAAISGTSVVGFQFPEQYGVGVGHRFDCEWTGYAEYRRMLWGKGADVIQFVPPQGAPLGMAQDWADQDVYVLGAEYRPGGGDTVWRLGTNYGRAIVPDDTLNPLYPAITEWHYTAGWERELSDGFSVVTSAVYAPEVSATSSATNQLNQLLGLGQPFTLSREDWQFGIGLSWRIGKGGGDCGSCDSSASCDSCGGCPADCAD